MSDKLQKTFEELRKNGHNSVDNLIKWMKDAKIIDQAKGTEDKARKLFEGCKDKKDVELVKFQEVVARMARENKRNLEELSEVLVRRGPKLVGALKAAGKAFKDTMKKK